MSHVSETNSKSHAMRCPGHRTPHSGYFGGHAFTDAYLTGLDWQLGMLGSFFQKRIIRNSGIHGKDPKGS